MILVFIYLDWNANSQINARVTRFTFSDAGVSGAASSQNLTHQQAPHQLGQTLYMPGVTQHVAAMQRPLQVKTVSLNHLIYSFTCSLDEE